MTAFTAPIIWGPSTFSATNNIATVGGFNSTALDDADDSVAIVAIATKDGTIDAVGAYCSSIDGNPPAYNIGLVTIDANGAPTTTNYGGSATETHDFTGAGWVWKTLATPATAQAGEFFAIRVWPTASAPDGTNHAHIAWDNILVSGQPFGQIYATSWTSVYFSGALAARYSTGEIIGLPAINFLWGNVDSGTTPDEVGNKFSVPANMKCIGARIGFRNRALGTSHIIKLYDNADNLLGSSGSLTVYNAKGGSAGEKHDVYWDEVNLTAGSTYRITFLAENTYDTYVAALDFESEESKNKTIPDGSNWQATSRTNAGAWTDDASGVAMISLLISEITFTTGSGGGAYGFAG